MENVSFFSMEEISEEKIRYVVAAVRYQNQWLFSRHKLRSTWDMPGGHREPGETLEKAMARELWEETGALQFQVRPVAVYAVENGKEKSYGALYFIQVAVLGELPAEYEMEEICLTDQMPTEITYPNILPSLYNFVQGWLNLQSNPEELWDIYDADRNKTGRLHRRGDMLAEGEYHLVVHVWIRNRKGQFLLTKRSPEKGYPNMWEATGGSALSGDDSLKAAIREVKEETGLSLDPKNGKRVLAIKGKDYHQDVWVFCQDFDLENVSLQSGETVDKMCAGKNEILALHREGLLVPYEYLQELFQILDLH